MKPIYDVTKTYEENFKNPPEYKRFKLCGSETAEWGHAQYRWVGVAAGPLLNSGHILAAINAGANIVVYKTVRTRYCECLPFPNCVGLKKGAFVTPNGEAFASKNRQNDKLRTNSFGMPSLTPEEWMPDVGTAAGYAKAAGRMMIVSCVGTPDMDATDQKAALEDDYALCAKLAVEAGAEAVELNFSCPNVKKDLGAIYLSPEFASTIVIRTRARIGNNVPIYIKVGHFPDREIMEKVVLDVVKAGVAGIVGINTIPMFVYTREGVPALPGRPSAISGVCGKGIAPFAEEWLEHMVDIRDKHKMRFEIGSCGGIAEAKDFFKRQYQGADMVFTASGFMSNPKLFGQFHKLARGGDR